MSKATDVEIVEARVEFVPLAFRAPLKFGGRVLDRTDVMNSFVRVRTRAGKEALGLGSMPVGNVWAWPSQALDIGQTASAIKKLAERVAKESLSLAGFEHPLDHVHDLAGRYRSLADETTAELGIREPMPKLAVLVAASIVDAAIHDAYGKANGLCSFNALSAEFANRDLSHYLTDEFRGEYLDRYTLREPKPTMPLYHLVGALDPLEASDVSQPIGDGLPETLGDWIRFNGLTHLKIKLAGDDLDWDVDRVVRVDRAASRVQRDLGRKDWCYSVDFNEKCPSVDYVIDFLNRIEERRPEALPRIQYVEQPTHRDLAAHPENLMHEAAKRKPVVIDESLVDLESLQLARRQGYSGVALKACKGHTEALLMGAAAQKYNLFLCVQDLTCVGASFLHSAELAARIPTVAAIEGNGRQFCPAGNKGWDERFPTMFEITDGTVGTAALVLPGLGHVG